MVNLASQKRCCVFRHRVVTLPGVSQFAQLNRPNNQGKGIAKQFLNELLAKMKGKNYYNNDNAMIDYFDRSHYTDINIGKWNKPYKLDIENMGSSFLPKVA